MTTTLHQQSAAQRAEPAITLARRQLMEGDATSAHDCMRAALDACRILGPVETERQPIAGALKPLIRQFNASTTGDDANRVQTNLNGDASCKIDADAVLASLRTAIQNAALSGDAVLLVNVDAAADIPVIELIFDGPGTFAETWYIGGIIPIPFEELRLHWTRHTAGGRLDRTPNGIAFKLIGQREPHPTPDAQEAAFAAVVEAERELRIVVADGKVPKPTHIQRALDAIDAAAPQREPADIGALLRSISENEKGFRLKFPENIPPIAVYRERLAVSLKRLCELAQSRVAAGATVEIETQYDSADHTIEIEATYPRDNQDAAWRAAATALERVVEELHDGTAIADLNDEACVISLTIPDTIGAAIDQWIPGFTAFSDRSIQMLRLLKSGGQAPPEDIILPGVLESELERWLLPKFEAAPAVNVAHDLEKESKGSPRLEKAIGQIRRGKPKKEICAPPYAAEILRTYSVDERGQKALGLNALSSDEIKLLLDALASEPPGYLECLRLLAKITHAASA